MRGVNAARQAADDNVLSRKLAELRELIDTSHGGNAAVIVIWEAIKRITSRNQRCVEKGIAPYPLPEWVNEYLLHSADKIRRLTLGIRVEDDRPLHSMNFNGVGELRKVREVDGRNPDGSEAERFRDRRIDHLDAAFGFVGEDRANAFQRYDHAEWDVQHLAIIDDPSLDDNKPLKEEVRHTFSKHKEE